MMRYIFALLLTLFSIHVFAEEPIEGLVLDHAPIDRSDIASIRRGAKFFATNCMSCHTLVYLRYDKLAKEEGITYDKMPVNVKTWPYGVTPPDLSLETGIRGVNWVYTYLHSFYVDPKRPTGANNLLVPNTAMPNMVGPYQGDQMLVTTKPEGDLFHQVQWYDLLKLTKQGSMSSDDFDKTIADVVNFLAYAEEPFYQEQQRIGWWVLSFLFILLIMTYFLKREYWRDVKKSRKK